MSALQKPTQMIYNLTAKELEVLQRLVEGDSYKLIAHYCQISISTVQTHIMHIYENLHVNSKGEAINKALRDKIVNFSHWSEFNPFTLFLPLTQFMPLFFRYLL